MATDNFILRNWDEQERKFFDNLSSLQAKFSRKQVHDIRINIKKLRAYLEFCEKVTDTNCRDALEPLKAYFQYLGKYYDLEMSVYFIRKLTRKDPPPLPFFENYLFSLRSMTRVSAKKQTERLDKSILETLSEYMHINLKKYTDDELSKILKNRTEATWEHIRRYAEHFEDNAHPIRKLLKALHYWLSASGDNVIFNKKQLKVLDELLNELGIHHDYFVLEHKLKYFRREYLVKGSHEFDLSKKWQHAVHNLENQLLNEAGKKSDKLLREL